MNKIGRITPRGVITEFALPRPNSGPGDITMGPDGALWFVELSGGVDGVRTDGNRIGRITYDGRSASIRCPAGTASPINIAVGPGPELWYAVAPRWGACALDRVISEVPPAVRGRAADGLSAGSDRQPPRASSNRLWLPTAAPIASAYCSFRFSSATRP